MKTICKKKLLKLLVSLVIFTCCTGNLFADELGFSTLTSKPWQAIVDGQPSEGAFIYRIDFNTDGTARVIKQFGGSTTWTEEKTWELSGKDILIKSKPNDEVKEFDGASLRILNADTIDYFNGNYKGIFKPYKHLMALIHWLLILVVLVALNEIFRRNKWAILFFFVLLPLVLTPFVWSQQGVSYWFKWVKVYSVVFAVIWFTTMRFTKFGKYDVVKLIAALFLAVNIVEAVIQDFLMGYTPNILSGVAGVLSTITLFYGWKYIAPDNTKEKDLIWPAMTVLWIVAYDVWNIVYVYLNFPGSTSAQLMVLLSCTIPALFIKKGTWLQARAFTLAVWFMYYFTFPRFTEQLELLVPRNNGLMYGLAILSFVLNAACLVVFAKNLYQKKNLQTS